jgi:hypothetical protein
MVGRSCGDASACDAARSGSLLRCCVANKAAVGMSALSITLRCTRTERAKAFSTPFLVTRSRATTVGRKAQEKSGHCSMFVDAARVRNLRWSHTTSFSETERVRGGRDFVGWRLAKCFPAAQRSHNANAPTNIGKVHVVWLGWGHFLFSLYKSPPKT